MQRYDVTIRAHYGTRRVSVCVTALDYLHAMERARALCGIRGPYVQVVNLDTGETWTNER